MAEPFWILVKQEMIGWQWHQLDHMQIICTFLHTDNHTSTSSLNFLLARCSSCRPANSIKALKAYFNLVSFSEMSFMKLTKVHFTDCGIKTVHMQHSI